MSKNIYLATKLFSFFDRTASTKMYEAITKTNKYFGSEIFLPFRDSNLKIDLTGDVTKNIFDADINSLENTDVFISRLDGMAYDAGIGFELGYCLAKDCLIYIFTTDYYVTKVKERKFLVSNMLSDIANVFKYEYHQENDLSYEDNLANNAKLFTKFVTNKIDSNDYLYKNKKKIDTRYDVFFDFSGLKYEWCKILIDKLIPILEDNNLTYFISDRYNDDYNTDVQLASLDNSKSYIMCLDETEPDLDSSILQGYAYKKGKYIIGYKTHKQIHYIEGMQAMGANLMVEKPCNELVDSFDKLVGAIKNIKDKF